jgi:programmed cell death protein 5
MQQINPQEQYSMEEKRKIEALKRDVLSRFLTKEARERLSNLRYAHPDMADEIENLIIQSALSNKLKAIIDDKKLKELLVSLSPEKKETKISFNEK